MFAIKIDEWKKVHWEVISACPWAKCPKPASNIFPNSVNGDPVLPLPHVPDTTVLFSYDRCLSWQQVLQTPTGSGMWPCLSISAAPTLVLTMVISHLDYSSSLLTCIHPHSSPVSIKHRCDSLKTSDLSPTSTFYWSDPRLFLLCLCPHPFFLLCSPVSFLVLNPLGISPLHPPLPLWGSASPGLLEPPYHMPRSAHTRSEQSPHTPVWPHFPLHSSSPWANFLFFLILSTCLHSG